MILGGAFEPMKVLMLTDYFPPHVGGVEKVVFEVSKRLAKKNCEVVVITFNTEQAKPFEIVEGVRIHRISGIDTTRITGFQFAFSFTAFLKILRSIQEFDPDIIHVNHGFFFTTLCAVLMRRFNAHERKRLVITWHQGKVKFNKRLLDLVIRILEETLTRYILKTCDQIIAVSDAVRDYVTCMGVSSNKVRVVTNGVDLDEFRPKESVDDTPNRTKRIVFVGRLVHNKGVQYLVEAAPSIIREYPNVRFVIAGDGPLTEELRKRTGILGVESTFEFLGVTPNIADILRESDLFVLPSLFEGMSLTVLEAMACSLPIVATNVGGTPEVVIDNKTGLLVEPCNAEQLAHSILEILGNEKLGRQLGRNARLFVEKHHSWDECAKSTMQVYEETLKNNT